MRGSWMLSAALAALTGCVYPLEQGRQLERRVDELSEDLTKSRQHMEESERRATADRQQLKAEQEASIQRLDAALAESVKRLDNALAEMNRRIDARMVEVTKRVEELDRVAHRSGADLALEQEQIREKLSHASEQLSQVSSDLAALRTRLGKVAEAAENTSGLPARFDGLSGLVGSTTQQLSGLAERLGGTDEKLAQVDARIKSLSDRVVAAEAGRKESELHPALRLLAAAQAQRFGDTAGARTLLESVVAQHDKSSIGDEAHFALGELEFGARRFREAIGHLKGLAERLPPHARTIEAQLRIGQCFLEMKDAPKARLFLEEVEHAAPQSDAGRKAADLLRKLDAASTGATEKASEKPADKGDKKPEKKSEKPNDGKRDRTK